MALRSTQPLTEMSTRNISWGKGGRCVRLTTLPPSCAVVTKSGNLNFLEPSGPVQACNGTALPYVYIYIYIYIYIFFPHDNVYVSCLTLLRELLYINNLEADVLHISFSVKFISQDEPIPVEHLVKVCAT